MSSLRYIKPTFHQKHDFFLQLSSFGLFLGGVSDMFWMVPGLGFWHSLYFQVWWGWKVLQPWKANPPLPAAHHHLGTSVLIVPKWHPAPRFCHHSQALTITVFPVLPSPSPSHPVSPFFSSIQLPVWSSDWFILICSTHIPRLDIAKQPPLSPWLPFLLLLIVFFFFCA